MRRLFLKRIRECSKEQEREYSRHCGYRRCTGRNYGDIYPLKGEINDEI